MLDGQLWQELFGDPVVEPRRAFIIDKIMARCTLVDRGYKTRCLEWGGPTSGCPGRGRATGRGHSYPRITLFGCAAAVHRALWITIFGWLPAKKQLDHLCKNRICVRPDHCEPVTHLLNQKRKVVR